VKVITNHHPRSVLLGAQAAQLGLPVCDHYCGVMPRMIKSLALQRTLMQEFGTCVFDVTLDCEDGAPVGERSPLCYWTNSRRTTAREWGCVCILWIVD
jgi:citrate lyase subunit beta/citryl-CoA lyase